jgi:hypothetical protein
MRFYGHTVTCIHCASLPGEQAAHRYSTSACEAVCSRDRTFLRDVQRMRRILRPVAIRLQMKNVPELRYLRKVVLSGWYRVDVDFDFLQLKIQEIS